MRPIRQANPLPGKPRLRRGAIYGMLVVAASVLVAQPAAAVPLAPAPPVHGFVHGGQEIWVTVDPFAGFEGHTVQSEGILALCKRWGADQRWWYWVIFDQDSLTGHIPGDQTNIRHSFLDRCRA